MKVFKAIQDRIRSPTPLPRRNSVNATTSKSKGTGSNKRQPSNQVAKQSPAPMQRRKGHTNHRSTRDNPSVSDYQDSSSLQAALRDSKANSLDGYVSSQTRNSKSKKSDESSQGDHTEVSTPSSEGHLSSSSLKPVEWKLPLVDKDATEPQTMEQEFQRLQVLQSYFILDAQGEVEFDRITRHAAKLLQVPICLISLVDLGRVWFLSRVGLDAAVAEAPRKHAFCSHVVYNKYKQLIVPDLSKDERFKENPLVTDGFEFRFYAGAALISPEGYKLGTLCLLSPTVRPEGLSSDEQEILHELAAMVVSTMVARRTRLLKEDYEVKFLQVTQTLLNTQSQLQQAQGSIQSVLDRQSWSMDPEDTFELSATVKQLAVQSQVCAAVTRNVLQDLPDLQKKKMDSTKIDQAWLSMEGNKDTISELGDDGQREDANGSLFSDSMLAYEQIVNPTTDMQKLFDNLNTMCGQQFPHKNVVTLELYDSVPKRIVAEDLLLFRSILNLLTHCIAASGSHPCAIRIRNRKAHTGTNINELLIHCMQGGPLVPFIQAKEVFHNPNSLLAPVATMVRTMGGQYGMFHSKWESTNQRNKLLAPNASKGSTAQDSPRDLPSKLQSIYWLQIPYELPDQADFVVENISNESSNGIKKKKPTNVRQECFQRTQIQVHQPNDAANVAVSTTVKTKPDKTAPSKSLMAGSFTSNTTPVYDNKTDPFLQATLEMINSAGCGSRGRPAQSSVNKRPALGIAGHRRTHE